MAHSTHEERFVLLEMKIAYQEKLIAELNEVLVERGRTLDELVLRLERMEHHVRDNKEEEKQLPHDRPPHY